MPFAHHEPYVTTPGLVPPEMFFGREREAALIEQGLGPCFVHGGRQAGKTALLRHVERTHHAPLAGAIVRWIDLRLDPVGSPSTSEDLWSRLARELLDAGVLKRRFPLIRPERVAEAVKLWLDQSLNRRIRLLVDEADQFLEQDAEEHYPQTTLLRDLMEETEGRFKIVFAGGAGVFRVSRLRKHPLAGFGASIALGSLADGGEVRAARALVEEPLSLLGYRFRPGSVARLLAHTGHDPALIQHFGCSLLRHVSAPAPEGGPPHWITAEHVDAVQAGREWRTAVRQHVAATPALDPRYEVVAGALTLGALEGRAPADAGASAEWLREQAAAWWPEGFASLGDDEFQAVLEEMTGLGVLRSRPDGRYAVRNARALLAIGTASEVKATLSRDGRAPRRAAPLPG